MNKEKKARVIAFYLPQFHPIPENDEWWGKGFTEWTNVGNSKPLFKGHYQPRVPADLGYYDLRLPEVRKAQAELARDAGLEGFCYYHYWFGNGRQLLERPFNEVLASGEPDFPFCLCWANHKWSNRSWDRRKAKTKYSVLVDQTYPGKDDHIAHFYNLLPAFKDKRYIKVDGKPIFLIFHPYSIPETNEFITLWNSLAVENGLNGIYFVGITQSTLSHIVDATGNEKIVLPNLKSSKDIYQRVLSLGYDAVCSSGKRRGELLSRNRLISYFNDFLGRQDVVVSRYDYSKVIKNIFAPEDNWENVFPSIFPQWDRSARCGREEGIYINATPDNFRILLSKCIDLIKNKEEDHRIILINSWNEWAEGSYLEPDLKYGHGFLDVIKECLNS